MTPSAPRDYRRILLIKPSSPGDILHALPVLHGLRRRFPQAHLAWLVATPFAELIETDPALDEVIRFDRKRFGFLGRSLRVTGEFFGFLRSLRRRRFDLVIDLQGLFRSGFLAWVSGAKTRIGFADAREFAWLFYTDALATGDPDLHAADKNYAVAKLLGFAETPMDFSICLTDDDRRVAEELLTQAGIAINDHFAVLVPGTRWETKRWPAERFGRVAKSLAAERGLSSVLIGGASDAPAAREAVRASDGSAKDLCGRTTLRQAAAIIARAAVVVTADSTPMHLATVLNRPLVALFGPTNPRRTGPYGRLDDVLRLDLPCSPCYYRKLRQCPYLHKCMNELSTDRVVTHVCHSLPPCNEKNSDGA